MQPDDILKEDRAWTSEYTQILNELLKQMHEGNPNSIREALQILQKFEQRSDLWQYCPDILQDAEALPDTKFLILNVLHKTVKTRWAILPVEERLGVRNFITLMTMEYSTIRDMPDYLLQKTNQVFLDIIIQEWPENWLDLMENLILSAREDARKCQNILTILIGLAEGVFDEDKEEMTKGRRHILREALLKSFEHISVLCSWIIELYRTNPESLPQSLMEGTIKCLTAYAPHVDISFMITNEVPQLLCKDFFDMSVRIPTISFLTEVVSLRPSVDFNLPPNLVSSYKDMICSIFAHVITTTSSIPPDYMKYYVPGKVPTGNTFFWEEFWMKIAMFCSAALRNHFELLNSMKISYKLIDDALTLFVNMIYIEHEETLKVLLDFWQSFLLDVFKQEQAWNKKTNEAKNWENNYNRGQAQAPLQYLGITSASDKHCEIVNRFQPIFDELRRACLQRMVKPQEVYITYDPISGTLESEWITDTEELHLYGLLKDINVFLCHLGNEESLAVFGSILTAVTLKVRRGELANRSWDPSDLNKLCWTVGSVAGALKKDLEVPFIIKMLSNLLWLCENKQGRDNKAVVASMTMHIVGNYPVLLANSRKFLEATIIKQFQFMRETFPGVQEMAVETLLKICRNSKEVISKKVTETDQYKHTPPGTSLLDWMISETEKVLPCLKNPRNLLLVYESLATCVSGLPANERDVPLEVILTRPMNQLRSLIQDEKTFLLNLREASRQLVVIFRTFVSVCSAVKISFYKIFDVLFKDACFMYKSFSETINKQIEEGGIQVSGHDDVRQLRLCKKEILVLIGEFISSIGDEDKEVKIVAVNHYVPPILEYVLQFYRNTPDVAKDLEVLKFCKRLAEHLSAALDPALGDVFECVFQPTLSMIMDRRDTFMDHRRAFYELLDACTKYCIEGILQIQPERLKVYVESLAFGARHEQPLIADLALTTIKNLLTTLVQRTEESTRHNREAYCSMLQDFCNVLYFDLLFAVLAVTTDTMHKNGYFSQCEVLYIMFAIVTKNQVSFNVTPSILRDTLVDKIHQEFPNMSHPQTKDHVEKLLSCSEEDRSKKSQAIFDEVLRDFLIETKVFRSIDDYAKIDDARTRAEVNAEKNAYLRTVEGLRPDESLKIEAAHDDDEI